MYVHARCDLICLLSFQITIHPTVEPTFAFFVSRFLLDKFFRCCHPIRIPHCQLPAIQSPFSVDRIIFSCIYRICTHIRPKCLIMHCLTIPGFCIFVGSEYYITNLINHFVRLKNQDLHTRPMATTIDKEQQSFNFTHDSSSSGSFWSPTVLSPAAQYSHYSTFLHS